MSLRAVAVVASTLALAACGSTAAAHRPVGAALQLTADQQEFATAMQVWLVNHQDSTGQTDAQIVRTGETTCTALRGGATESTIAGAASDKGIARALVRLAGKYLCPGERPRVLLRMSGSGIENSSPFPVTSSSVTVRYSFDCSNFGQAGNFQADLETGNQVNPGSDDQPIAKALAISGHETTTVHPEDQGADYHISIDTQCSWTIAARSD